MDDAWMDGWMDRKIKIKFIGFQVPWVTTVVSSNSVFTTQKFGILTLVLDRVLLTLVIIPTMYKPIEFIIRTYILGLFTRVPSYFDLPLVTLQGPIFFLTGQVINQGETLNPKPNFNSVTISSTTWVTIQSTTWVTIHPHLVSNP